MASTRSRPDLPFSAGLVAAAGEGQRLGRGPKAFLEVQGSTLLERIVVALSGQVDEIVVAVPEARLAHARELAPAARVVVGGASRQETVFELLRATSAELVLIHDVARPFLPADVVERVLSAAAGGGGASAAVGVADTLIHATGGAAVDRDAFRAVQTPQAFRRRLLLDAHLAARDSGGTATDDAGLVRAAGGSVELVEGSPWLMKLTTPADLALAEVLAKGWDDAAAGRRARTGSGD